MVFKYAPLVLTTALCAAAAQPRHLGARTLSSRNETEACAQVGSLWASQKAANATARIVIDGQLAYDCLNSVPLNVDNAVRLVSSIQPFLEWQTSELRTQNPLRSQMKKIDMVFTASSYLRDPPEGYPFPGMSIYLD